MSTTMPSSVRSAGVLEDPSGACRAEYCWALAHCRSRRAVASAGVRGLRVPRLVFLGSAHETE